MRLLWQSGGDCGAMMRSSFPQPIAIPVLCQQNCRGCVANTAYKIEIRYYEAGLRLQVQVRLYPCDFD
ncbi:hypothetical protein [Massilioclostridium coli]|uniref:hypothetical protein n=1 Tax=Massilioclostridium coli TaxID=1870991 RepID=UPI0011CB2900|nr:hypothetical protein [Massilioclostridium coli]